MGGTDEIILGPDEQSGHQHVSVREKMENASKTYAHVYIYIYTRLCVRMMKK